MATTQDFADYVCEQMGLAGAITYKKMFGEYGIYCDGKIFALICDNQVFIKPTEAGEQLLPGAQHAAPYQGAKPHIILENLEDKELLAAFVSATCQQLPMPKPKKKNVNV